MNQLNLDLLSDTRTNLVQHYHRYNKLIGAYLIGLADWKAYDIGQLIGEVLTTNHLL